MQNAPVNNTEVVSESTAAQKEKKSLPKPLLITIVAVSTVVVLMLSAVLGVYFTAQSKYMNAEYDEAIKVLSYLDFLQPFRQMQVECEYDRAENYMGHAEYYQAYNIYTSLSGYRDADKKATEALWNFAFIVLDNGNYEKAIEIFEQLGEYKDSDELVLESKYLWAESLAESEDGVKKAADLYEQLGDYKESEDRYIECVLQQAIEMYRKGRYEKALESFSQYSDDYELAEIYEMLCTCAILQESGGATVSRAQKMYDYLSKFADEYEDVQKAIESPFFFIVRLVGARWECDGQVIYSPFDEKANGYVIRFQNLAWKIIDGECWWDAQESEMFILSENGIWFSVTGFSSYDELHPERMYVKSPAGEVYIFELVEVY